MDAVMRIGACDCCGVVTSLVYCELLVRGRHACAECTEAHELDAHMEWCEDLACGRCWDERSRVLCEQLLAMAARIDAIGLPDEVRF